MISRRGSRALAVVALAFSLAAGTLAAGAGDDRGSAEALLREVASSPEQAAAGELVTRSKAALDRGAKLRAAGDESHARLADSLARTWAEAAREVVRAAAVEGSGAAARRGAADAGVLAERERALLEEAIAQSGRLRAQLDSSSREGKGEPVRTSTQANTDGGAKPARPSTAVDGGKR